MEENELQRALPVGTILKSPKFDYRIEAAWSGRFWNNI